jgi:hypothetical protein
MIRFQQATRQVALQRRKPKMIGVITLQDKLNQAITQPTNPVIKDDGIFAVDDAHNLILYAVPRGFHIFNVHPSQAGRAVSGIVSST